MNEPNQIESAENLILALMSGTSVDTIDAAVCRVWHNSKQRLGCEVLAFHEHPIEDQLRQRIFQSFGDGAGSLSLACSLNFEIGSAFAHAAMSAVIDWGGEISRIAAIASHGQTLYHIAPHMVTGPREGATRRVPSTLQVGEPSVIAALTGRPVISNFRVADMAMGGNGAPLVPFADFHLFSEPGRGVVIHNLGGIGNCTWLPPDGNSDTVVAFDTGPANMIIDALVGHFYPGEKYDNDGRHGAAGKVIEPLLAKWMAIPYIDSPPPKSTGRELFGVQFVEQIISEHSNYIGDDLIATATEFTARSLARNLELHIRPQGNIDELIVAGGGGHETAF